MSAIPEVSGKKLNVAGAIGSPLVSYLLDGSDFLSA